MTASDMVPKRQEESEAEKQNMKLKLQDVAHALPACVLKSSISLKACAGITITFSYSATILITDNCFGDANISL